MHQFYQKEDRQVNAVDCIILGFDKGKLNLLLLQGVVGARSFIE